jgi:hypothetical protein
MSKCVVYAETTSQKENFLNNAKNIDWIKTMEELYICLNEIQ